MKSLENIEWVAEPFPHAIIDNFLNKNVFMALTKELNRQELEVQSYFNSSLEKKISILTLKWESKQNL